jgi:hypothetical protein
MNRVHAKVQGMPVIGVHIEIGPKMRLVDGEAQLIPIYASFAACYIIVVMIVPSGEDAVKLIIENMFPFKVDIFVPVRVRGIASELERIVT